jgi:hypothetical protein
VVTFGLAALYGAVEADVIGAVRRWGEEMRPLRPTPAHVVVNGFPVGPPVVCGPRLCETWTIVAESALDRREPRHPPVVRSHVHEEDLGNGFVVSPAAGTRSLIYVIVVFELTDGSPRAVGVVCSPNDCEPRPRYDR